jgi:hypothetical protein
MASVTAPLVKAGQTAASVVESVGKDIVAVVGIIGSALAAAGGVVSPEIALYVTTGLAVLRTIGEDLENTK